MQLLDVLALGLPAPDRRRRGIPPAGRQRRPRRVRLRHRRRQAPVLPPLRGEVVLRAALPPRRLQCQRPLPRPRHDRLDDDPAVRRPQLGIGAKRTGRSLTGRAGTLARSEDRTLTRSGTRPARQRVPSALTAVCQVQPGLDYCIGVEREGIDTLIHQPAREVRVVGRPLPADADVLAGLLAGLDGHGEERLDGRVALVKERGDDRGVAVDPERQLRHVVRPDRHAVKMLEELARQQRVGRQLAHHDQLQAVPAALESVLREQLDDPAGLRDRADEGHHDLHVVEADVVAHAAQRPAFELEAGPERGVRVARGAAEPEHRVFLVRLVLAPADQVRVLVGLEVRQPHDHRLGRKGRRDAGDAFRELLDEEAHRVAVAGHLPAHLLAHGGFQRRKLEQRPRVHADHAVDDELEAREADPVVRDRREIEGAVRVADVHHDPHGRGRQGVELDPVLLEVQAAFVDGAGVAFGAGHGDRLAVPDLRRGVAAADHRRYAELARDDRRVAGAAAAVRDDGRGALHDRLPVRVGHVRDDHVARLDARHLAAACHDAGRARADALADCAPLRQRARALLQRETLDRAAGAALHRLRARLQDVDRAGLAVLAPLDVHRAAIVRLDDERLARELVHVGVVDAEARPLRRGDRHDVGPAPRRRLRRVNHAARLRAQVAADDRLAPGAPRRLVDVELVRVHGALHDELAEPPGRGDEDRVAEAGLRVEREHDAARADVAAHHVLDADRDRDLRVVEPLVGAIRDRAVVVQRRIDLVHGRQHRVRPAHVQDRLLLPGERRVRQVFGRRGRAHGDGRAAVAEPGRGGEHLALEFRLEARVEDPPADARAGLGETQDVFDVDCGELAGDARAEPVLLEEVAVSLRRGRESAGHLDAGAGQAADHLAERRVLAADGLDVLHPQLGQGDCVTGHARSSLVPHLIRSAARRPATSAATANGISAMKQRRTVFFVSDQTGVTAETMGHSLLTQFDGMEFRPVTLPFITTVDKAREAAGKIDQDGRDEGIRPIVFATLVNDDVRDALKQADCLFLDFFDAFLGPLEQELGMTSAHVLGRAHGMADLNAYTMRINATNFALANDDGAQTRDYERADVILVGVSRSGKTPTCVYMALQYGAFAANYPLTEDDLEGLRLPAAVEPYRRKLFGLTIEPGRLQQIRQERRPDSRYASAQQCAFEVRAAEQLFDRNSIPYLETTDTSIEEIASRVLERLAIPRRVRP